MRSKARVPPSYIRPHLRSLRSVVWPRGWVTRFALAKRPIMSRVGTSRRVWLSLLSCRWRSLIEMNEQCDEWPLMKMVAVRVWVCPVVETLCVARCIWSSDPYEHNTKHLGLCRVWCPRSSSEAITNEWACLLCMKMICWMIDTTNKQSMCELRGSIARYLALVQTDKLCILTTARSVWIQIVR